MYQNITKLISLQVTVIENKRLRGRIKHSFLEPAKIILHSKAFASANIFVTAGFGTKKKYFCFNTPMIWSQNVDKFHTTSYFQF